MLPILEAAKDGQANPEVFQERLLPKHGAQLSTAALKFLLSVPARFLTQLCCQSCYLQVLLSVLSAACNRWPSFLRLCPAQLPVRLLEALLSDNAAIPTVAKTSVGLVKVCLALSSLCICTVAQHAPMKGVPPNHLLVSPPSHALCRWF